LVAAKHRVTLLSVGAPEHVARLPGMARRLRTVSAALGRAALELPLYEGRAALGQAQLYVLGLQPSTRADACALLASAAASLTRDGLLKPEVIVAWDDAAAHSLSTVRAATRLFVLPTGVAGAPLDAHERKALAGDPAVEALGATSLTALGAAEAHAVVVPSPSARRRLERDPAMTVRASDQPIVAVRLGCDDPPYDPATDPTLAATYSVDAPAGKSECRRALARHASLALGPRTLLVVAGPLSGPGGEAVVDTLARLARLDVATLVASGGDRALTDRASVLAIEHPGKIAVRADASGAADRQHLAGADAVLLTDTDHPSGRPAGLALRYGAVPVAVESGAYADHLVDHDAASATGFALLFPRLDPFEIEAAIRRALALRSDVQAWQNLVRAAMGSAPLWANTVAQLEALNVAEPPAVEAVPISGPVATA